MDLKSYSRWYDYSRARDEMFAASDSAHAPWFVVPSDDKRRARLNIIHHLLEHVPYKSLPREKIKFPKRQKRAGYQRAELPVQVCEGRFLKHGRHIYMCRPGGPGVIPASRLRIRRVSGRARTYSLRFMTLQMSSLR